MSINARWRIQPFTGDVNSILIEDEEHTIEFIAEINSYGFYANEGVVLDAGDPVILVQDNTAQTAFVEQPRTIAPNAGQFRVDYDDTDYYNTGFVQCNSTDNGKAVLFTYRGTGTIVHPNFRLNTNFNLPGNAIAEGDLEVVGNVSLASATGSTITANNKKIEDVSNPTADGDAVPVGFLNGRLPFRSYEELTSTGTWTKPAGVSYVFVEAVGGGGGGGGTNNTGVSSGGGGASGETKCALLAVSGNVSYTIGAGGAGGATDADGSDGSDTVFSTLTAAGGKAGKKYANPSGEGGSANSLNSAPGLPGYLANAGSVRGGNGGGLGGGKGGENTVGSTAATAGAANTGGGGGGGGNIQAGAAGGSGIIRLWY